MSDVRDLYRNAIVNHYKAPQNFKKIENANRSAIGHNPLCGDKFSVFLYLENDILVDIGFTGSGCAIATASASMMTEKLKGTTETEARAIFKSFINLLTSGSDLREDPSLGELAVFSDVRGYPARVKCAALIWHAMHAALEQEQETVQTE